MEKLLTIGLRATAMIEIEYFIDDDTRIGEVYLDGDLIYQHLDVQNDSQLERALNTEYKVLTEAADIQSNFIS